MNKNTIVSLCYNKWRLTDTFLRDLFFNEQQNIDKVILVDNHSEDPEVEEGLDWWENRWSQLRVERMDSNYGFTLGANFGLSEALKDSENVFLISNDVRIFGRFVEFVDKILENQKSLVGNSRVFNSGWVNFGGTIFDYLDGSFLAATSEGWKELGLFDPKYSPGDFEDVDLSTTAKKLGYKLVALNSPNIVHLGAGTTGYSPDREIRTRKNQEYFKNKWMKE